MFIHGCIINIRCVFTSASSPCSPSHYPLWEIEEILKAYFVILYYMLIRFAAVDVFFSLCDSVP